MAEPIVSTTHQSWGSRLGDSVRGIGRGAILFILSFAVLFWNEGRTIRYAKDLGEVNKNLVITSDAKLDPVNEGKPVYVSGDATTEETLADSAFGIEGIAALKLKRVVKMYQWKEEKRTEKETKKNLGGSSDTTTTTTYSYSKDWFDKPIDSDEFYPENREGHENPRAFDILPLESSVTRVTVGDYQLSQGQIEGLINYVPLPYATNFTPMSIVRGTNAVAATVLPEGSVYYGENPRAPQIGDLIVTFQQVKPEPVSIIARQRGNSFQPYIAKKGNRISILSEKEVSPEMMIDTAKRGNRLIAWLLRIIGVMMMYGGLSSILRPLSVLADVVPFIGTIVGIGTNFIAGTVSVILSLLVIAIAWVYYRPLIGITLIVAAAALIVWAGMKSKAKLAAANAASPAQARG